MILINSNLINNTVQNKNYDIKLAINKLKNC